MVDIHCHLLPGIDDGSRSWEMSLEMCRMAADDGVEHIVATPHANHEYEYDRARYTEMLEELRRLFGGTLGLSPAATSIFLTRTFRTRSSVPSSTASAARATCSSNSATSRSRRTLANNCASSPKRA